MNTWTPLWSGTVESSLWDETDLVVKVFLTMLAVKDADHVVRFNAYQLARKARKTETEVLEALKVLMAPDTKRQEKQPYNGARIKAVEDGWLVLNGEKYREKVSEERRKERNRKAQANWRARQAGKPEPYPTARAVRSSGSGKAPLPGERAYVEALEEGGQSAADAMLDSMEGLAEATPDVHDLQYEGEQIAQQNQGDRKLSSDPIQQALSPEEPPSSTAPASPSDPPDDEGWESKV